VRVYSVLSAEILGCSLMRNDAEHHITDAQRAQFDWQNSVVINTAACAIIAQFIDDGLLAPTAPA